MIEGKGILLLGEKEFAMLEGFHTSSARSSIQRMKINHSVKQCAQSFSIDTWNNIGLIKSSEVLPVFNSDKGNIQMKLSRRNWWDEGNREETESTGHKARPSATLSANLSHGTVQNRNQLSTVWGRRLKAIARAA